MVKRDDIISLGELERGVSSTVARVIETKDTMFVAAGGRTGVAIVDIEEYNELVRLADKGFIVDIVEVAEASDAAGDSVPWEVARQEWEADIERWKQEEDGGSSPR